MKDYYEIHHNIDCKETTVRNIQGHSDSPSPEKKKSV